MLTTLPFAEAEYSARISFVKCPAETSGQNSI